MLTNTKNLRPSLLPKLEACPRYVASEDVSDAAHRGAALDKAFRLLLQGKTSWRDGISAEDAGRVEWAAGKLHSLWEGAEIESRPEKCRIFPCADFPNGGEADAVCFDWQARHASADLKSGQWRDYSAQQAKYALGFMDMSFADEWTTHTLFCDVENFDTGEIGFVQTKKWTREEAEAKVAAIVEAAGKGSPRLCEYCAWCAVKDKCTEQTALVKGGAAALVEIHSSRNVAEIKERILSTPANIAGFLEAFAIAEKEILPEAKKRGIEFLQTGGELEGFTLVSPKPAEEVAALSLGDRISDWGWQNVLSLFPAVSASKLAPLWRKMEGKDIPLQLITRKPRAPFLRAKKNSKTK